jgi:hypothetical protein
MLAERYGFSTYDAMIVASALHAGCDTLWSEDIQDGMVIEETHRQPVPRDALILARRRANDDRSSSKWKPPATGRLSRCNHYQYFMRR